MNTQILLYYRQVDGCWRQWWFHLSHARTLGAHSRRQLCIIFTIRSGVIRIRTFVFADVWNCVLFRCFGIYWERIYWLGPLLKIKRICAWVVYSILCWTVKNNITISLKKCCCESVIYSQCVKPLGLFFLILLKVNTTWKGRYSQHALAQPMQ